MLKIIPAIDMLDGKCVRLNQGDYGKKTVYSASPADQARAWEDAGAEIIHLVDLDGAKAGHPVNLAALESICRSVKIPCELGGGIRTEKDAETAFALGISRVILGTAACESPELAEKMVMQFGSERIVVGIDAKNGRVALRGWLETSGVDALDLARNLCRRGVKRIIFTDIATDGMLCGPNLGAMKAMCESLPECSVIASGGVSSDADVKALSQQGKTNLEGVIVGKALYDGRVTFASLCEAVRH